MKRWRVYKCRTCDTWFACYEGGAQGFVSWRAAFDFADALCIRLKVKQ